MSVSVFAGILTKDFQIVDSLGRFPLFCSALFRQVPLRCPLCALKAFSFHFDEFQRIRKSLLHSQQRQLTLSVHIWGGMFVWDVLSEWLLAWRSIWTFYGAKGISISWWSWYCSFSYTWIVEIIEEVEYFEFVNIFHIYHVSLYPPVDGL